MPEHFTENTEKVNGNEEEWRDIKGYEGLYQVSNRGRVKSLPRISPRLNKHGTINYYRVPEIIRKPGKSDKYGHLYVPLYKNNISKNFQVHQLVLTAFVEECPDDMEGCHNDGNPSNNNLNNLRWDTHKSNHLDRIQHNTNNRGQKNGSAKLTESDVVAIRQMYASNKYLMKEIAGIYGMSNGGIRSIIRGFVWKHVDYLPESDFGRGVCRTLKLNC